MRRCQGGEPKATQFNSLDPLQGLLKPNPRSLELSGAPCERAKGFPGGAVVKNPPANAGDARDAGSILVWKDPLEEEMATHSCILAWKIPWTEEPGRLQSMGLQGVGHN